jgi:hypothetical protein
MPRAISKCPRCGTRVSPFAAGCAICGADLEAARAAAARRRPAPPRIAAPPLRGEIDWIHIAVAALLALAAPPIGLLLALYWAVQRYRLGQPLMVAAMVGATALAVGVMLAPGLFWTRLLNL